MVKFLTLSAGLFALVNAASITKHKRVLRRSDADDDADDDDDDDAPAQKPTVLAATGKKPNDSMLNNAPPAPPVAPPPPPPPPPAPKPAPPVKQPWEDMEEQLKSVQSRQEQLRNELKIWSNHADWDKKIEQDKTALSAATTEALADMLGDIRTELHQLAVPVYTDVLYDNLAALAEKESLIKEQIAKMKVAHAPEPEAPEVKQAPAEAKPPAPKAADPDTVVVLAWLVLGIAVVVAVAYYTK